MIPISNSNLICLVDKEDSEKLLQFSWYINNFNHIYRCYREKSSKQFYANGYRDVTIAIANEIFQEYTLLYDHKDRNPLNNVRSNLRPATQQQNCFNRTKSIGCSSIYKGVCYIVRRRTWIAYIKKDRVRINLGYFKSEELAARAYDAKALKLFGEFCVLNFPPNAQ